MNTPSITEIIARLGHACGLPWARCGAEHDCAELCARERGHGGMHDDGADDGWAWSEDVTPLPPTLAEWAAEWEREYPGKPRPVASWTDGRVSWDVDDGRPHFDGRPSVCIEVESVRAFSTGVIGKWIVGQSKATGADVVELGRIMQAVDGAR